MNVEPEDKPWRPADHPRPGPSWAPPADELEPESEEPPEPAPKHPPG